MHLEIKDAFSWNKDVLSGQEMSFRGFYPANIKNERRTSRVIHEATTINFYLKL